MLAIVCSSKNWEQGHQIQNVELAAKKDYEYILLKISNKIQVVEDYALLECKHRYTTEIRSGCRCRTANEEPS